MEATTIKNKIMKLGTDKIAVSVKRELLDDLSRLSSDDVSLAEVLSKAEAWDNLDHKFKLVCNEGIDGVLQNITQYGLPKPVEVPEFVASWYEEHSHNTLEAKFRRAQVDKDERVRKWYDNCQGRHANKRANAQEVIAKTDLSGYTVVKDPRKHVLKLDSEYYDDVVSGFKKFEIRFNDRDYKVGDILVLEEYDGIDYTGDRCKRKVIYITDYAQQDGYVVLGIEPVEEESV